MMVATDGNVRTTVACTAGTLNDGLKVAFTTGAIMGFTVVGLGLFGISGMYILVGMGYDDDTDKEIFSVMDNSTQLNIDYDTFHHNDNDATMQVPHLDPISHAAPPLFLTCRACSWKKVWDII